jgi:hypothetical protein
MQLQIKNKSGPRIRIESNHGEADLKEPQDFVLINFENS